MKKKSLRQLFFCLAVLWLLPVFAQAVDEKTVEISVLKNDTLIDICERYLEDPSQWPEIARINRLKNHDLIYAGQRLAIPTRLLRGLPFNGRVFFIKGDVAVRPAPQDEWKPLRKDEMVQQGNSIRTGPESAVEIVFEDGTSFFQRPETVLDIQKTQIRENSSIWQRMILRGGQLFFKVRRISGQDSRFEIQTPAAVAAARGTDFRVSVDSRQNVTAEVLRGKVDIRAKRRMVALQEGEGTRIDKGKAPLNPRRLLPPPSPLDLQAFYQIVPFRIRFADVEGAAAYRMMISTDAEGKDVVYEKLFRRGESPEVTGLDDGQYYLHATSVDKLGIEGFSPESKRIQVRVNPVPPFIQEPVDAAQYKGTSVEIRWMKVPQATRYFLEIGQDREFTAATRIQLETADTSYHHAFQDSGSYYFRIRSLAADGFEGIWSDTVSFTLDPVPVPLMEKPLMDEKELRIRWKGQGVNMTYRCQIARDENFLNPEIEQIVEMPQITLHNPLKPGRYFVRTSTIDPEGHESAFSEPQIFEIKNDQDKWVAIGTFGVMMLLFIILP